MNFGTIQPTAWPRFPIPLDRVVLGLYAAAIIVPLCISQLRRQTGIRILLVLSGEFCAPDVLSEELVLHDFHYSLLCSYY